MKKIGFISTMCGYHPSVPRWAGCEELWGQTAKCLANKGLKVGVNVFRWPEPVRQIQELQQAGCVVTQRRIIRGVSRFTPKLVYRWLDQFQPDMVVITLNVQSSGLEWAQECLKRQIPYVLIVQLVIDWWPDDTIAEQWAQVYEQAAACYFLTEGNLAMVRSQLAISLPSAKMVRNPFNVSYHAGPSWPVLENCRLACVGRLQPSSKGQDVLLDVLKMEKWRQRPLQVTFYGSGQFQRRMETIKKRLNLENVFFGGFVPDVEAIWAANHGLVLPSRFEGMPLAVVEAMLCGRPCIVTKVAGGDLIEDNITGFVATAPTASLLDEAMERAWLRRAEWEDIGQLAGAKVRELVPRDPCNVFATELEELMHQTSLKFR